MCQKLGTLQFFHFTYQYDDDDDDYVWLCVLFTKVESEEKNTSPITRVQCTFANISNTEKNLFKMTFNISIISLGMFGVVFGVFCRNVID